MGARTNIDPADHFDNPGDFEEPSAESLEVRRKLNEARKASHAEKSWFPPKAQSTKSTTKPAAAPFREPLGMTLQESILTLLCYDDEHCKMIANVLDINLMEGDYKVLAER